MLKTGIGIRSVRIAAASAILALGLTSGATREASGQGYVYPPGYGYAPGQPQPPAGGARPGTIPTTNGGYYYQANGVWYYVAPQPAAAPAPAPAPAGGAAAPGAGAGANRMDDRVPRPVLTAEIVAKLGSGATTRTVARPVDGRIPRPEPTPGAGASASSPATTRPVARPAAATRASGVAPGSTPTTVPAPTSRPNPNPNPAPAAATSEIPPLPGLTLPSAPR